jgi:hypothetical protein
MKGAPEFFGAEFILRDAARHLANPPGNSTQTPQQRRFLLQGILRTKKEGWFWAILLRRSRPAKCGFPLLVG